MINSVKFEKNGLFEYRYDGELKQYFPYQVHPDRIFCILRERCEIADDVTLLDIFRTVASYKDLMSFLALYSGCKIEDFHAQAEDPPIVHPEDKEEELKYLQVTWFVKHSCER